MKWKNKIKELIIEEIGIEVERLEIKIIKEGIKQEFGNLK